MFLYSISVFGQSGIGINLSFPERGGTFVDVAKENYRWTSGGSDLTASQVDEKGWPTTDADYVWDNRPVAEWAGSIDDPQEYRVDISGTYKCSFLGEAEVSSGGDGTVQNLSYEPFTNLSTFDFVVEGPPGPGHGFVVLQFRNTKRAQADVNATGLSDFRMYRPGYQPGTARIFTDEFISALMGINFEAVRFMPFVLANNVEPEYPAVTEWNQRKLVEDASQDAIPAINKPGGVSWETVILLANMVKKDIWLCIPASATTEYVTGLATLVRDNLDASLNIYIENSNEVWNNIFPQRAWNLAQSQAMGIGEHENHARRTVEIAQIFASVFGVGYLNTRIRPILCSHAPMLKWWVEPMLNYIEQNIGPPSDYLYGISSQAYFSTPSDAGLSVQEILTQANNNITAGIDETGGTNEAGKVQWVAMAEAWNLPGGYFVYEGGGHPSLGSLDNLDNQITAERDSLMGELLKYNYGPGFLDVGGRLAMHFILSSSYTRYGSFGLTDDINNPNRNYKYAALQELAGVGTPVKKTSKNISFKNLPLFKRPGGLFWGGAGLVQLRIVDLKGETMGELKLIPGMNANPFSSGLKGVFHVSDNSGRWVKIIFQQL